MLFQFICRDSCITIQGKYVSMSISCRAAHCSYSVQIYTTSFLVTMLHILRYPGFEGFPARHLGHVALKDSSRRYDMLGQLGTVTTCRIPHTFSAHLGTRSVFTRTSVPRRPELRRCSRNFYHSHLTLLGDRWFSRVQGSGHIGQISWKLVAVAVAEIGSSTIKHWSSHKHSPSSTSHHPTMPLHIIG